ncbi:hypothetical protein DY052_05905 [Apilactobacillus timberlakei]|uniref:hypothetical protein n=1 Tax=Apilactobacillus timberlakei TaxID=2008380 RepID=UPI00112ED8AA|nr:hypothetical protein [Apilactobacillus timberlakei]TPR14957.1 hypothetical protein DY052_05905 [Apilactobacillus timberlakei]
MANYLKSFGIFIIFFVMFGALLSYSMLYLRDSNSTVTLQDSLQTSVMAATDKSSRVNRGTFVLDLKRLQETLGETEVKEFNGKKPTYKIQVLKDNQSKLSAPSNQYQSLYDTEIDSGDNDKNTTKFNDYAPRYVNAKAVRVVANFQVSTSNNGNNKDNKHIATYVLQNTTANDDDNDLTK